MLYLAIGMHMGKLGGGELPGTNLLQCDHMITWLHVGDAFADRFDDTGSFVSEDNGKGTFWVLAGEGVCVCSPVSIEPSFVSLETLHPEFHQ